MLRPRRRTALSVTAAAAVLIAAPLLTSCGTPYAGAAAVVGGKQIPVSAVQSRVDAVRAAQEKSPQSAQLIQASSDLQRNTVHSLVQRRVIEQAARNAGVGVTRYEIQQTRTAAEQQAGGSAALEAQLLQTYAMVPADIDESIRTDLLMQKLAAHYGADTQTATGQAAILKVLRTTSDKLGVEINPRYGAWDSAKLSLTAAKEPWVKTVTKTTT
jgi:hypothetical protein